MGIDLREWRAGPQGIGADGTLLGIGEVAYVHNEIVKELKLMIKEQKAYRKLLRENLKCFDEGRKNWQELNIKYQEQEKRLQKLIDEKVDSSRSLMCIEYGQEIDRLKSEIEGLLKSAHEMHLELDKADGINCDLGKKLQAAVELLVEIHHGYCIALNQDHVIEPDDKVREIILRMIEERMGK